MPNLKSKSLLRFSNSLQKLGQQENDTKSSWDEKG